mmetsp:Transcript_9133/g.14084  ORF Transcript_9133/g.14084 Transcript_9133/m.14084 type:complete len:449 (-) Transcript_9133:1310-2656(-)|eukprot:CAMPEP_0201731766 /NCGR_PEP_ID=MMETSP0593-20130828/26772_1 /ASSEMBLY_ACC=CAM_ASM_000672 /TAXON_ID=267983 /ORGANISM="Skeletonema japonicum, Strain CCMP2506" /LENGTH=448 /DNA_ID=CAMNT_0048224605 /DNA_START=85 /DNA_END=1431 /DNA_ORIENTATION=-
MSPTDETLPTVVSADDAQPLAVVDDNIPTDDVMPPTPDEESKAELLDDDCSSSSQEMMMISDAENNDKSDAGAPESADKTSTQSSDHEGVSNETPTDSEEEIKDENQVEAQTQSEVASTEVDTSRARKDAETISEKRQEEKETAEENTDAEGCVDDTFVSVELSSSPSKNNNSSYEEVGGQQEQQPLMDAAPVSNTAAAAAVLVNPSSEMGPTDAAVMVPPNNNSAAASKSSLDITQPTSTTKSTRRRKILHHPILSHLTKLPWDRLSNAGSACDILFNCKYSMKQVEDEVREECRRGVSGEGVYIEDNDGCVGREDGYVNVSLNSCSDYQYQEEGCEAQEFEQILGCCSMLDNDEDSDDEDVECVLPENSVASQKATHLVHPMIGLQGSHAAEDTNQEEGEEEREYSGDNRVNSNNNELQQQQQSEKSWKQSNPSLDMMLYHQFLNE